MSAPLPAPYPVPAPIAAPEPAPTAAPVTVPHPTVVVTKARRHPAMSRSLSCFMCPPPPPESSGRRWTDEASDVPATSGNGRRVFLAGREDARAAEWTDLPEGREELTRRSRELPAVELPRDLLRERLQALEAHLVALRRLGEARRRRLRGACRLPALLADHELQEVPARVVADRVEVRLGQPPLGLVDLGPDDRLLLEDGLAREQARGVHDAGAAHREVVLHDVAQLGGDLARRQVPRRRDDEDGVLDGG